MNRKMARSEWVRNTENEEKERSYNWNMEDVNEVKKKHDKNARRILYGGRKG